MATTQSVLITVLLISTLATNGLLALWAATSPRHWFWRTAFYLACVSPLLLVPAYEPLVTLTLQGGVIAVGASVGRWMMRLRHEAGSQRYVRSHGAWRFSLLTLLQCMALTGAAAAVASRMPELNRFAWQSIGAIGFCSGLAIVIVVQPVNFAGWRRFIGVAAALVVSLGLGVVVGFF